MKEEKIEVVKTWAKPKSVRDIQILSSFANFYQYLIKGFSKIIALYTSMFKIVSSNTTAPKGLKATSDIIGERMRIGGL